MDSDVHLNRQKYDVTVLPGGLNKGLNLVIVIKDLDFLFFILFYCTAHIHNETVPSSPPLCTM